MNTYISILQAASTDIHTEAQVHYRAQITLDLPEFKLRVIKEGEWKMPVSLVMMSHVIKDSRADMPS